MKVLWLNDSLVLRADSREEKEALAVIFAGLGQAEKEEECPSPAIEHCEVKSNSTY